MQSALARASVKVAEDGDRFKFNTGVAALMMLLNELEGAATVSVSAMSDFVIMLAPFAPHLAESLWEKLGGSGSVHQASWPSYDQALLQKNAVEVVVQVGGKRRGSVTLAPEAAEATALSAAQKLPAVMTALNGQAPSRVIYVPGKIINLVLGG